MTPMDHVNILLEEYRTLRAEIVARTTNGYQLLTLVGGLPAALFLWINWKDPATLPATFWIVVFILGAAFVLLSFALYRDIILVARRLRELESKINDLAGTKLLEWETRGGGGIVTYMFRKFSPGNSK